MDGKDSLGLQDTQRVTQRRHRNPDDFGQLALRNEGSGLDLALEQGLQNALIGDVAQPLGGDRLIIDEASFIFRATCTTSICGLSGSASDRSDQRN